jgi:hypothetical protein
VIAVRIPRDLLNSLKDQAKQRGRTPSAQTLSAEVRRALEFWVHRFAISRRHNSRLGMAVAAMADRIEEITDKSWIDDSLTRQVVREHVQEWVSHILSPLSEPVDVPADIKEGAGLVLALLKDVTGSRKFLGAVIIDDPGLAMILQDLNLAPGFGDERVHVETRPALFAGRKQDDRAWADAMRTGTDAAFMNYVRKFPWGRHATKARRRPELVAWREQEPKAWADAENADTAEAIRNYLHTFGSLQLKHAVKARERLATLENWEGRK